MPAKRKILVTHALPYANGPIHLGHLVESVQTDLWVRLQKMRGHECIFVCADDTHGTPVMLLAEREGKTPEELIEGFEREHRRDYADFSIDFDHFHSTHSMSSSGVFPSRSASNIVINNSDARKDGSLRRLVKKTTKHMLEPRKK